jgi:NAD(P)-dependent dehydrogenase (short-subunit alcohol dehydrogenase family)
LYSSPEVRRDRLARQGSMCVDRNAAAGPDLPASLAASRIPAHFRATDVSDAESLRACSSGSRAEFGVFDLLINNASIVLTTRSRRPPRPYL